MRIVFLGAPGSGKGTQSKLVSSRFQLTHISTGDLFRMNISNKTILGNRVKSIIEKGGLVPDELTLSMVRDRISQADCAKGFILDGYPRNLSQARDLDLLLGAGGQRIDKAILLDIPRQSILERIAGRRFCTKCGASYHVVMNPSKSGCSCDQCGALLTQRSDDKEEVVEERLSIYEKTAKPILDYYNAKGILHKTIGNNDIERVFANICGYLQAI